MEVIRSKDNTIYKYLKKLHSKKYRSRYDEFLLESKNAIIDGIKVGFYPEILIIKEGFFIEEKLPVEKIVTLEEKLFDKISNMNTALGVIGVYKSFIKPKVEFIGSGKYVYLDRICDPGNMGTLIRSAVSFGFQGVVLSPDCVDIMSPKVLRSTLGGVFKIKIFKGKLSDFSSFNLPIILGDLNGVDLRDFHFPKSFLLVLGNEGDGISDSIKKLNHKVVTVKMKNMESLNVGVAGSILMYKAGESR